MTEESDEEQSIEEIEAEYRALMSEKNVALKAAKVAKEAKDAETAFNAKVQEEVDKKLQATEEARKLKEDEQREQAEGDGGEDPLNKPPEQKDGNSQSAKSIDRATKWLKSKYDIKFEDIKPYSNSELNAEGANPNYSEFAFADSDSDCPADSSAWSPDDVWCNAIWYAAQCKQQLAGKITVRACDIKAGDGLTVQIRHINADTFPSALTACECASCVSNVFATYSLTLARYDLYKVMCNLDEFDVGDVLPTAIAQAMVNSFQVGLDALVYAAIRDATPGYTETSGTSFICDPSALTDGYCCAFAANLYGEVIELEAQMRTAGYFNDADPVLILSPRVALYMKYKEGINPPPWVNNITMDGNKLAKIGDISVIEYCGATACTNSAGGVTGDNVIAVLIDPSRAVGEAYGKRPLLKKDEDPIECDSWKFVYRMYVAVSALDTGAIGHVLNP